MSETMLLLSVVSAMIDRFVDGDLDVVLSEDAVREVALLLASPPEHTTALEVLRVAGWLHWCRAFAIGRGGGQKDLDAALNLLAPVYRQQPHAVPEAIGKFLDSNPPEAGNAVGTLSSRGRQLMQIAFDANDLVALTTAINWLRDALAITSTEEPEHQEILEGLSFALGDRYKRTNNLADLDHAIDGFRKVIRASPSSSPIPAFCMHYLAVALMHRYEHTGDLADLNQAVTVHEQAVAATPPSDLAYASYLSDLGASLAHRSMVTGERTDLDLGLARLQEAVATISPTAPELIGLLSDLALALRDRYDWTGDLTDLNQAIARLQEVVAATTLDSPDRGLRVSNLGSTLVVRFDALGDLADLELAVSWLQEAVAATSVGSSNRAAYLSNLGAALRLRYERTGGLADLNHAIDRLQEAVTNSPEGAPRRAGYLSNLGIALQRRYERTSEMGDLNQAIMNSEQAVVTAPPSHRDRPVYLSNLGLALQHRYERTGTMADLNHAIEWLQQAVTYRPEGSPGRPGYLSNLGQALQRQHQRTGALADLNHAIDVTEEAVKATPPGNPDRAGYMSNLGSALRIRYDRSRVVSDLDQAIDWLREAVAATSADSLYRVGPVSTLGTALARRFQHTGDLADLNEAVALHEQAVAATPPGHPYHAAILTNLGVIRRRQYQQTGDPADLDQAILDCEKAVTATPSDSADRALRLFNLGGALRTRFERTGTAADRDQAVKACREAVGVVTASPSQRALAARLWGETAALGQDWTTAVDGYAEAIGLLARVAPRSLARTDQEFWLGEFRGLGAQAAACCLQAGQREQAVELWEQGRGVLLAQALDTRTDLADLAVRHPQLAAEFIRLRDQLDDLPATSGVPTPIPVAQTGTVLPGVEAWTVIRAATDRRRELADQFDEVVAEIRAQPDFDRFLLPPPFSQLAESAADGPVVLVNVSHLRSDALLLTPAGLQVVPFPEISPQAVRDRVAAFLAGLAQAQRPATEAATRDQAEAELNGHLGWLWDAVAGPVLDALGYTTKPDGEAWPRMWWCPSGLLAYLPLHAAGHHATRFGPAPQTVLDRVVSCYTPTIRGLAHARRSAPDSAGARPEQGGQVIVVAMTHTPGAGDLPGAAAEAELVRDLCPGEPQILTGPHATYDSVTSALPGYPWAHFACHGVSDLEHPSTSHLLLADHLDRPLTVVDVARLRLDHSELAFLSACSTAQTGTELADEAIHLAAAFQLAGYRRVVATLWPIGDRWAVQVARGVYTRLANTANDPAAALHHATRGLRAILPGRPSTWAAHLYNGA